MLLLKDYQLRKPLQVTQTFAPSKVQFTSLVDEIWARKWFTNHGPLVEKLEGRLAEHLGVKCPLTCVVNGAAGLHIILKALDLKGSVVTTPFSYVATTACPLWEGLRVIYADIDPRHLTIDPLAVEAAIQSDTSAILATHVFGNPCDVIALEKISKKHGIPVLYDAAHAFGVRYRGASVLEWGKASMVSTHATKVYHTGEGGFVYSQDEALSVKMEWMRRFGHNGYQKFHGMGTNAKMSELHAALGLAVLEEVDKIISARKKIVEYYDGAFSCNHHVKRAFELRSECEWNYSYYPVLCESETALLRHLDRLNRLDIYPRRYFHPALNTVDQLVPQACGACPVAEDVASRIMCLPLAADYSLDDISRVIDGLSV